MLCTYHIHSPAITNRFQAEKHLLLYIEDHHKIFHNVPFCKHEEVDIGKNSYYI
jgi:hypothetical protein